MTTPSPTDQRSVQEFLDRRTLALLRWVVGSVAIVFVVFFVYNAVDFPPGTREPALVYDAAMVVGCTLGWWAVRTGRITPRWAHPTGAVVALATAGNVLMVHALVPGDFYTIFLDIIVVALGALMLDIRWTVGVLAAIWLAWLPLTFHDGPPADVSELRVRFGFTLLAATIVSIAVAMARVRDERRVAGLALREQRTQEELRATLDALEHERRELDAKVAERTAALVETNESLRNEVRERRKVQETANNLAEQLLHSQRLEAMGRLAGGISHDFNNLLTAVRGNIEEVLETVDLEEEQRLWLYDALRASERATRLTRQLLAFSRRQTLEEKTFDLLATVDGMRRMLSRTLGDRITLEVPTVDEIEGHAIWVHADPAQIEGVILNLALNARDAMPEGGTLEIGLARVAHGDADGEWAVLSVRDTGSGMDPETRERLFEPFFTTKPQGQGTGLGLAIVYGVVQQHGGRIEVTSEPGHGSSFEVWLPAASAPSEPPADLPPLHDTPTGSSETILLVEDDEAVRRLTRRVLTALGYRVLQAADADQAEAILEEGTSIDLLLTDIQMPGRTGVELAASLRERLDPELPVLLCSGYVKDHQALEDHLDDRTALLPKPFSRQDLATHLRRLLDTASSHGP